MTAAEVRKKLADYGFTFVDSAVYPVVEHRGEQVGTIYSDSVYLAQHYPSLDPDGVSTHYPLVKRTIIMYSHPVSELDDAIKCLLDSPERIDTEKRKKRIDTIRRYFDERRQQL